MVVRARRARMNPSIDDGLVLHLPLSEGSGSKAWDRSQYQLHTVLYNTPVWQTGGGLHFDGVNQYALVPHNAALNLVDELTIAMRFKMLVAEHVIGAPNARYIFGKGDNWTGEPYAIYYEIPTNRINFTVYDGTLRQCYITAPADDIEHTLVATFDGRYMHLYMDGLQVQETDIGSVVSLVTNADNIGIGANRLGARPNAQHTYWVRLYNRCISEPEIKQLSDQRGRI